MEEFVRNEGYWCWWLHRYLYYVCKSPDGYDFKDIADATFTLTEDQANDLFREGE